MLSEDLLQLADEVIGQGYELFVVGKWHRLSFIRSFVYQFACTIAHGRLGTSNFMVAACTTSSCCH
jgi:hypothetical protein